MKRLHKISLLLLLSVSVFGLNSCGVYSLSGASIPPEMNTVSIDFFENSAPIVVPSLSQEFTEALKDRVRNQSRLSIVRTDGDASFEGRITGYSINPTAVQGDNRAGLNRLTITVQVKFVNIFNEKLNFEQTFSRYVDFSTNNGPIQVQEPQLIRDINAMLTEDIFNRAFANW